MVRDKSGKPEVVEKTQISKSNKKNTCLIATDAFTESYTTPDAVAE